MDEVKLYILSNVALIILLVILIMTFGYFSGNVCRYFIQITYLYLFLTIALMSLVMASVQYEEKIREFASKYSVFAAIGSLVPIIALAFVSNPYIKHILWIAYVILAGIGFTLLYEKYESIIVRTLFASILIAVPFVAAIFIKPDLISFTFGKVLLWILLGVIIVEIIALLSGNSAFINTNLWAILIISLFLGFLMYDNKLLIERAKYCKPNQFPDYLSGAIGMFIDMFNIFTNMLKLQSNE